MISFIVFFAAVKVQAGDEPLTNVIIAQPGHDDYGIPLYLADNLGYFKEQGLAIKFVNFKSSPLSVASLLAKEVQLCLTSYDQALKTYEKGKVLKIILTTTDSHPWCIIAQPEIKRPEDLKGKNLSAKMPGSGPRAFVSAVLLHYGINPEKDVTFVDLPGTAIIPAFTNHAIDATFGSGVHKAQMLNRGGHVLVDMNDPAQHMAVLGTDKYPLKVVLTTDEFATDNPEIMQKFTNAVAKAMKWESTHSSKEIAENVKSYFLGSIDEAIVDDVRKPFSHTGLVTASGHEAIVKQSISVGMIKESIPMDAVVDMSFMENSQKIMDQ
ncbi:MULTISPECIES: ABC transporter substrate-binding protein [unclassified Pseudodesulfovibrio]|uniref:ABC transporter substrate-binding protein n=1 Tax=unclassified Pseudodesulfovibrio TaxID=2661612 RepID=UPI0013E34875|nr:MULTISPECIES: ABC transporter substrate-binding protein [unclassified Pseudodesulfovibrio]MCJ2164303.1 ABC transporter substrate-binding protein [Pseudodesulfovibrio sp. S3-i]